MNARGLPVELWQLAYLPSAVLDTGWTDAAWESAVDQQVTLEHESRG